MSIIERYHREFPGSCRRSERAPHIFPPGVPPHLLYMEAFPIYIDRQKGSHKWDVDGHELIDYWSGHGAMLLGHGHPAVVEAVQRKAGRGRHRGAGHEMEM